MMIWLQLHDQSVWTYVVLFCTRNFQTTFSQRIQLREWVTGPKIAVASVVLYYWCCLLLCILICDIDIINDDVEIIIVIIIIKRRDMKVLRYSWSWNNFTELINNPGRCNVRWRARASTRRYIYRRELFFLVFLFMRLNWGGGTH